LVTLTSGVEDAISRALGVERVGAGRARALTQLGQQSIDQIHGHAPSVIDPVLPS